MDYFFFSSVLKVVENLGVSYVKSGDAYKTKLEAELRKLKFPYRVSINENTELFLLHSIFCTLLRNSAQIITESQNGLGWKGPQGS